MNIYFHFRDDIICKAVLKDDPLQYVLFPRYRGKFEGLAGGGLISGQRQVASLRCPWLGLNCIACPIPCLFWRTRVQGEQVKPMIILSKLKLNLEDLLLHCVY